MWIKYRHKWADGTDDEWSWMDLGDSTRNSEKAESYFKDEEVPGLEDEYNFSEHYRGVEFKAVENAPREVIEIELKRAREVLSHSERDVARYEEMLRDG